MKYYLVNISTVSRKEQRARKIPLSEFLYKDLPAFFLLLNLFKRNFHPVPVNGTRRDFPINDNSDKTFSRTAAWEARLNSPQKKRIRSFVKKSHWHLLAEQKTKRFTRMHRLSGIFRKIFHKKVTVCSDEWFSGVEYFSAERESFDRRVIVYTVWSSSLGLWSVGDLCRVHCCPLEPQKATRYRLREPSTRDWTVNRTWKLADRSASGSLRCNEYVPLRSRFSALGFLEGS